MPKKFAQENTKAVEARARKAAQEKEKLEKKLKEEEDKYWEDDDKLIGRKLERKEEREKKLHEKLQRKQESQRLLGEEMASLKSAKPMKEQKVTRHEIETHREREQQELENAQNAAKADLDEPEIEVNLNRLQIEHESARTVDEALTLLNATQDDIDKHPEKRMKAAYLAFEEENLPRLKEENPNMRLSQLKQLLQKEWMKSPKNPLIQNMMKGNK